MAEQQRVVDDAEFAGVVIRNLERAAAGLLRELSTQGVLGEPSPDEPTTIDVALPFTVKIRADQSMRWEVCCVCTREGDVIICRGGCC